MQKSTITYLILDYLEELAKSRKLLYKVLDFYNVDVINYAVGYSPISNVAYIAYYTDDVIPLLNKYGNVPHVVKLIAYTVLKCMNRFVEVTEIEVLNNEIDFILFYEFLRNFLRKQNECSVCKDNNIHLHIHNVLKNVKDPLFGQDLQILVISIASAERFKQLVKTLSREEYENYKDIVVNEFVKYRSFIKELYVFGGKTLKDIDIAVVFNTNDLKQVFNILRTIFKELCKKIKTRIITERLDLFIYTLNEVDDFLVSARLSGVRII